MAVAFTELTAISAYDGGNSTTFNTPTLTASADKLYLIFIQASYGATPRTLSSVSGGGLGTWTIIAGASRENTLASRRCEAAYAWSAAPGAGAAIAITFSGSSTSCAYAVYEITGFNTATPIGQAATSTAIAGTSTTPTLSSATAGSGIAASCQEATAETITVDAGGGWTAGENNTGSSPATAMRSAFRTDISDLSCGFSWATIAEHVANIVEVLATAIGNPRPVKTLSQAVKRAAIF